MSNFSLYSGWLQSLLVQLFVLVFNKLATRSKADSSSVYPMERKFAWRAANSFFKFPSNFFHSRKIFLFTCRKKFLSSPFTNSATIYVLAKVGPGILRALKRAPGPSHLLSRCWPLSGKLKLYERKRKRAVSIRIQTSRLESP